VFVLDVAVAARKTSFGSACYVVVAACAPAVAGVVYVQLAAERDGFNGGEILREPFVGEHMARTENTANLHERGTHAHRPRHVRAFWRSWLARLEGGFISRVTLGTVGALWRLQTCRCNGASRVIHK
jgi:hypothetical protein